MLSLADLGWRPYFQQQINLEEWETCRTARVLEQHKSEVLLGLDGHNCTLKLLPSMPAFTVGDWLVLDTQNQFIRLLERQSCFRRKASGSKVAEQLIATNVDTAFIVCSLNEDFNLNRIERYLALVIEAGVEPVLVLSKSDLCPDPVPMRQSAQQLAPLLCVEVVNGLDTQAVSVLLPWCKTGKTVVMLGSSGAGKSTLTNTLLGQQVQTTQTIRDDDAKGRHTTTRRSLLPMPNGALILDTPGMRELQLADCAEGVTKTFEDIEALAAQCRFKDCHHRSEPGCAIIAAIAIGKLDERRFTNYNKLLHEQARNSASLAERRANDRKLTKHYKRTVNETKNLKRN